MMNKPSVEYLDEDMPICGRLSVKSRNSARSGGRISPGPRRSGIQRLSAKSDVKSKSGIFMSPREKMGNSPVKKRFGFGKDSQKMGPTDR